MRIALGLQYDGAAFKGWQTQVHRNSVQDELEHALTRFAGSALRTTVAGRTDTGVHALGQVVHLDTTVERPGYAWVRGVNAFLPPAIAVQWAQPVPDAFHARFAAYERTYYYALYVHPVRAPLLAGNAGWAYAALDVEAMRAAAAHLVGQHDFTAFRSSQCQAKSPVKFMYRIDIVREGRFVHFRFRANAFLHHMVRNIMGCLIEVGRGRQAPAWVAQVRDSRDRRLAAPTFMPDGLYLAEVAYPAVFGLPPPVLGAYPWSSVWTDQANAP